MSAKDVQENYKRIKAEVYALIAEELAKLEARKPAIPPDEKEAAKGEDQQVERKPDMEQGKDQGQVASI